MKLLNHLNMLDVTDLNPNLKYVGYEFCITGLIKPEDYFETSRQVRFELMATVP